MSIRRGVIAIYLAAVILAAARICMRFMSVTSVSTGPEPNRPSD
jgi:hypothetical protein